MNTRQAKAIFEAALLTSPAPLDVSELRKLFVDGIGADTVRVLLEELRADWSGRAVELVALPTGWRFQSKPEFGEYLARLNPERAPKYSRAVMETLAIIAYRQPVSRGDIEDIRGVAVSPQIIKTLEEREWIEAIGHRDAPGRPAIFATTKMFLADLGLTTLEGLPPLETLTLELQNLQASAVQAALPDLSVEETSALIAQAMPSPLPSRVLEAPIVETQAQHASWPHPLPVPR